MSLVLCGEGGMGKADLPLKLSLPERGSCWRCILGGPQGPREHILNAPEALGCAATRGELCTDPPAAQLPPRPQRLPAAGWFGRGCRLPAMDHGPGSWTSGTGPWQGAVTHGGRVLDPGTLSPTL